MLEGKYKGFQGLNTQLQIFQRRWGMEVTVI